MRCALEGEDGKEIEKEVVVAGVVENETKRRPSNLNLKLDLNQNNNQNKRRSLDSLNDKHESMNKIEINDRNEKVDNHSKDLSPRTKLKNQDKNIFLARENYSLTVEQVFKLFPEITKNENEKESEIENKIDIIPEYDRINLVKGKSDTNFKINDKLNGKFRDSQEFRIIQKNVTINSNADMESDMKFKNKSDDNIEHELKTKVENKNKTGNEHEVKHDFSYRFVDEIDNKTDIKIDNDSEKSANGDNFIELKNGEKLAVKSRIDTLIRKF